MPGRWTRLRTTVLQNKGLKLVALLLAIVSWYSIRKATSIEKWLKDVPLKIEVDEGWAILDSTANSVDVLFRGSQQDILALSAELAEVEVNMHGKAYRADTEVQLKPKDVRALGGARAVEIRPANLVLSLDQEGEDQVPVKVNVAAEPPVGYEVEKVICTPASVTIYGPRQRIKEIGSVETAPLDLQGRVRSFELRMPVLPPSDRWVARIEPADVKVSVTLVERSSKKVFEDLRIGALISPEWTEKVRIWPAKVKAVLSGRADLVEGLQKEDIRAYVDCAGLKPTTSYDLPVRIDAPPGIGLSEITPPTVEVELGDL